MNLKKSQITIAFLVGLILGAVLGASPLRRHLRDQWDKRTPQERILARLASRLDLSPEQKSKVAAILEENRPKFDALLAEGRSKFETIRTETREEIRKVLQPDQIKKFEAFEAEMDARIKNRFPHHY